MLMGGQGIGSLKGKERVTGNIIQGEARRIDQADGRTGANCRLIAPARIRAVLAAARGVN